MSLDNYVFLNDSNTTLSVEEGTLFTALKLCCFPKTLQWCSERMHATLTHRPGV